MKKSFIKSIKSKEKSEQSFTLLRELKECPHCRSIHCRLKSILVYNFKGVSTKYINNCLVYYNFVNFAKESRKDKEQILLNHILNTDCISRTESLRDRPSVPLLVV